MDRIIAMVLALLLSVVSLWTGSGSAEIPDMTTFTKTQYEVVSEYIQSPGTTPVILGRFPCGTVYYSKWTVEDAELTHPYQEVIGPVLFSLDTISWIRLIHDGNLVRLKDAYDAGLVPEDVLISLNRIVYANEPGLEKLHNRTGCIELISEILSDPEMEVRLVSGEQVSDAVAAGQFEEWDSGYACGLLEEDLYLYGGETHLCLETAWNWHLLTNLEPC